MAYKWWRITNIITPQPTSEYKIYKLLFYTASGVVCDDIQKASMSTIVDGNIADIFDDTLLTTSITTNASGWWFSYQFDTPQILSSVTYLADYSNNTEWLTADIEYSTDGVTWELWQTLLLKTPVNYALEISRSLTNIDVNNVPKSTQLPGNILSNIGTPKTSYAQVFITTLDNIIYGMDITTSVITTLKKVYSDSINGLTKSYSSKGYLYSEQENPMLGRPVLSGKGAVNGTTYKNSEDEVIESTVYATPIGYPWIKSAVSTNLGKFSISHLSTNVKYDIYAKPINSEYQTKIATAITPTKSNSSYDFSIYSINDSYVYKSVPYTFKVNVVDNAGGVTYAISLAPVGVSISSDGIVTVDRAEIGAINFIVEASDDVLAVTKTLPINMYVNDVVYNNLPLRTNSTDTVQGDTWASIGTMQHVGGWGVFMNGAHYTKDLDLTFKEEFSISFTFVKYSFMDNPHFYGTIVSAGNYTNLNTLFYISLYGRNNDGNDGGLIFNCNNGSRYISRHRFAEYKEYAITYVVKNRIIQLYIDGALDFSYEMNDNTYDKMHVPLTNPMRIGYNNTTTANVKKESFGGLIRDFSITNGRGLVNVNDYTIGNVNPTYIIKPSLTFATNFYELPITSTCTFDLANNCIVFNDSKLFYTSSMLNMLQCYDYSMELSVSISSFSASGKSFVIGGIDKTTHAKKWGLLVAADGFSIDTNYGVYFIPYDVKLNTIYNIKILRRPSHRNTMEFIVNDVTVSTKSNTIVPYYADTLLSVGYADNVDSLHGNVYNINVTNYIL